MSVTSGEPFTLISTSACRVPSNAMLDATAAHGRALEKRRADAAAHAAAVAATALAHPHDFEDDGSDDGVFEAALVAATLAAAGGVDVTSDAWIAPAALRASVKRNVRYGIGGYGGYCIALSFRVSFDVAFVAFWINLSSTFAQNQQPAFSRRDSITAGCVDNSARADRHAGPVRASVAAAAVARRRAR
jgi:hypothetical protein